MYKIVDIQTFHACNLPKYGRYLNMPNNMPKYGRYPNMLFNIPKYGMDIKHAI